MKTLKKMNKRFKLEVNPWGHSFWVFYGYKNRKSLKLTTRNLDLPKEIKNDIDNFNEGDYAGCVYFTEKDNYLYFIHLIEKDSDTLMHELHHAVECIAKYYDFHGEIEAKAYLQEWLHKTIRTKIK